MGTKISGDNTEISRNHFFVEGERIKVEDKEAIYEIRDPKELALEVDFGFARYDIILRLIDKYFPNGNMSYLDLGCGLGYLMAKMSQKRFKTSGVDISKSFLDIAEKKLKHCQLPFEKLLEADLQKHINLPDASYDVITSTDVLEHIQRPVELLIQAQRLLKSNGKAIICTNNYLSVWGLEKFIKERILLRKGFHPIDNWFTFLSLRRMVESQGFSIIGSKGTYFLPLSKLGWFLTLLGIFKRRYEINDWLSNSIFKYFGRDIVLVLEKKSPKSISIRSGYNYNILSSAFSFLSDRFTGVKRYHTPNRLLNLFLVRLELLLRTDKVIGYPTFLVLEPTNICNFRCPLCPTGQNQKGGRSKGQMSLVNFRRIIDEIGPYLYSLRLENWGEPLLGKEIFDMVTYAKSKKISTSFNTNLSLLDEGSAEKLILAGLDHIKISLDGASKESYEKYRVGGDFKEVVNNIKLLTKKRADLNRKNPFIEVQFIVMRQNENEINQMKQLCIDLGVDGLFIQRLRPGMQEELFNPDAYCIEKYKEWLPVDSKYSLFDYEKKVRKYKSKICNFLWTTTVINWDGSIVPCCSIYDEKYDFGNIFDDGFKNVWNGPQYRAARMLIGKGKAVSVDVVCKFCFKKGIIT